MGASGLRTLHRGGALLSIVATVVAGIAFVVNGYDSFLGLSLGFLGPFFGFYFVGAVLSDTTHRVWGEELLRGMVWHFGSLVSWESSPPSRRRCP